MLEEFIRKHDVDIAMLQEVTTTHNITTKGNQTIANIGTTGRGAAIIATDDLQMNGIRKLPSGRSIAANYNNLCIVNIYASSGTSNRAEREDFYNTEITELLPLAPIELMLAGEFNCAQRDSDCTGQRYSSRALDKLTQGLRLVDAWDVSSNAHPYTDRCSQFRQTICIGWHSEEQARDRNPGGSIYRPFGRTITSETSNPLHTKTKREWQ